MSEDSSSSVAEYQHGRRPPYATIPHALIDDPDLDSYAIAVYATIARHADFATDADGRSEGAWASDRRLAKLAGCSPRTVRDRRELLRAKGWLDWDSGAKSGSTNSYVIHAWLPGEEGRSAPDAGGGRHHMPGGSEQSAEGVGTECRGGSAPDADKRATDDQATGNERQGTSDFGGSGSVDPSPPGEAPEGENSPERIFLEHRNELAKAIRESIYGERGQPPAVQVKGDPWSTGRDLSICRQLLEEGHSLEKVLAAVRGYGLMLRRGDSSIEFATDYRHTLLPIREGEQQGVPLIERCATYFHKHGRSRTRREGLAAHLG